MNTAVALAANVGYDLPHYLLPKAVVFSLFSLISLLLSKRRVGADPWLQGQRAQAVSYRHYFELVSPEAGWLLICHIALSHMSHQDSVQCL